HPVFVLAGEVARLLAECRQRLAEISVPARIHFMVGVASETARAPHDWPEGDEAIVDFPARAGIVDVPQMDDVGEWLGARSNALGAFRRAIKSRAPVSQQGDARAVGHRFWFEGSALPLGVLQSAHPAEKALGPAEPIIGIEFGLLRPAGQLPYLRFFLHDRAFGQEGLQLRGDRA